jgi:hypothetical protein
MEDPWDRPPRLGDSASAVADARQAIVIWFWPTGASRVGVYSRPPAATLRWRALPGATAGYLGQRSILRGC